MAGGHGWQDGDQIDETANTAGTGFGAQAAHVASNGGHCNIQLQGNLGRGIALAQDAQHMFLRFGELVAAAKQRKGNGLAHGRFGEKQYGCCLRVFIFGRRGNGYQGHHGSLTHEVHQTALAMLNFVQCSAHLLAALRGAGIYVVVTLTQHATAVQLTSGSVVAHQYLGIGSQNNHAKSEFVHQHKEHVLWHIQGGCRKEGQITPRREGGVEQGVHGDSSLHQGGLKRFVPQFVKLPEPPARVTEPPGDGVEFDVAADREGFNSAHHTGYRLQ